MGQLPATTFGIGMPSTYAPWGLSPVAGQPIGIQPQAFGQPFVPQTSAGYGAGLLQIVAQQLQHVQLLQQQQLLYLQQLLQIVPAQLQQLQQLIQISPQQLQQQWPASVQTGAFGLGLAPQAFGGQTSGHVM